MSEYSEDSLIEQPAVGLFEDLGWEAYNGYNEFSEAGDSPLLRKTRGEVVLDGSYRLSDWGRVSRSFFDWMQPLSHGCIDNRGLHLQVLSVPSA